MKNTIVIFSNPFGYGPTGKAIAIANTLLRSGYKQIIFAGSSFTLEIIPNKIVRVDCDERNESDIIRVLKIIENPIVISSQNRFAVYAAKKLGIRSAFVDGLAWFWETIPADHFLADEIFWMDYPNIDKSAPKNIHNIHIVPGIVDTVPKTSKRHQILVHIGGCENPLSDIFPKHYLNLLATGIDKVAAEKILITGGNRAVEHLRYLLSNSTANIDLQTLKHNKFIHELNNTKHFITTAGQTATLEAFALGIPTSFLLPMNLSQLALTNVLNQYNASPQKLSWNNYIPDITDVTLLNEKDAIAAFNGFALKLSNSSAFIPKYISDLNHILSNLPVQEGQNLFIRHLGTCGAETIARILIDKWSLFNR